MSIDQIFPEDIFEPENRGRFVGLLAALPIPPSRRKQTYSEYLQLTDQVADSSEIETITKAPNGTIPAN